MKLILFKVLGGFKNHVFQRLEWVGKLAAAPPPNVARVPPPAAAPVTSKSWVLSVAARAAEPQQAPVAPGRLASASQSWALGVAACTMYKLPGVSEAQLIPPGGFQNKYDNLAPPCRKPTRRRGRHKRLPAASRHERDASLSPGPAAGQVSHSSPLAHLLLPWQPRAQLLNKCLREAHRAPSETLAAAVRAATLDPSQHTSRDEYFLDESAKPAKTENGSFLITS